MPLQREQARAQPLDVDVDGGCGAHFDAEHGAPRGDQCRESIGCIAAFRVGGVDALLRGDAFVQTIETSDHREQDVVGASAGGIDQGPTNAPGDVARHR